VSEGVEHGSGEVDGHVTVIAPTADWARTVEQAPT
jgi:hypothetical protein